MENQTVGDAITDLLCIEGALSYLNWTHDDWFAMYTDYQYVNKKVVVKNKEVIKLDFIEGTILHPKELQDFID